MPCVGAVWCRVSELSGAVCRSCLVPCVGAVWCRVPELSGAVCRSCLVPCVGVGLCAAARWSGRAAGTLSAVCMVLVVSDCSPEPAAVGGCRAGRPYQPCRPAVLGGSPLSEMVPAMWWSESGGRCAVLGIRHGLERPKPEREAFWPEVWASTSGQDRVICRDRGDLKTRYPRVRCRGWEPRDNRRNIPWRDAGVVYKRQLQWYLMERRRSIPIPSCTHRCLVLPGSGKSAPLF